MSLNILFLLLPTNSGMNLPISQVTFSNVCVLVVHGTCMILGISKNVYAITLLSSAPLCGSTARVKQLWN